uniref:Uncharacterized protein n=1 Tax=Polytomella parva TaxID=51329 RepID=A0A7S0VKT3_9CHLO
MHMLRRIFFTFYFLCFSFNCFSSGRALDGFTTQRKLGCKVSGSCELCHVKEFSRPYCKSTGHKQQLSCTSEDLLNSDEQSNYTITAYLGMNAWLASSPSLNPSPPSQSSTSPPSAIMALRDAKVYRICSAEDVQKHYDDVSKREGNSTGILKFEVLMIIVLVIALAFMQWRKLRLRSSVSSLF